MQSSIRKYALLASVAALVNTYAAPDNAAKAAINTTPPQQPIQVPGNLIQDTALDLLGVSEANPTWKITPEDLLVEAVNTPKGRALQITDNASAEVRETRTTGTTVVQYLTLPADKDLSFKCSVKAEAGCKYRVYIEWREPDGAANADWVEGNDDWKEHTAEFHYEGTSKLAYLVFQIQGPGKAQFCNFSLVEVSKP